MGNTYLKLNSYSFVSVVYLSTILKYFHCGKLSWLPFQFLYFVSVTELIEI